MGSTPTQRLTARAPKRSVVFFNHTMESVGNWLRNCQSRLKLPAGHAPCNGTIGMRRRPEATKTPMAMTQRRKYPPTVSGRQTRSLVGLGRAGSPRTASGRNVLTILRTDPPATGTCNDTYTKPVRYCSTRASAVGGHHRRSWPARRVYVIPTVCPDSAKDLTPNGS